MTQPQIGSLEWLKEHALFLCDSCCEKRESSECIHLRDLRNVDGMAMCWDCYTARDEADQQIDFEELPAFDPFAFAEKMQEELWRLVEVVCDEDAESIERILVQQNYETQG